MPAALAKRSVWQLSERPDLFGQIFSCLRKKSLPIATTGETYASACHLAQWDAENFSTDRLSDPVYHYILTELCFSCDVMDFVNCQKRPRS